MPSMESRLTTLEARRPANVVDAIILVGLRPGDDERVEIKSLSYDGRRWERQEGECEEDFKDRACREASRPRGLIPLFSANI